MRSLHAMEGTDNRQEDGEAEVASTRTESLNPTHHPSDVMPKSAEQPNFSFTNDRMTTFSVLLGVSIFLLNMLGAWWVVAESTHIISSPLSIDADVLERFAQRSGDMPMDAMILGRFQNTELALRGMQNAHTLLVIAMASAFALMSIGFSLFVMGAHGAFNVSGSIGDRGQLVLKSTAPGLLCFLLATIIVALAALAPTQVQMGRMSASVGTPAARTVEDEPDAVEWMKDGSKLLDNAREKFRRSGDGEDEGTEDP